MTKEYKTIRIPAEDYEQAKQSKRDSETWGEFVQRCTAEPPEVREFVEASEVAEQSDFESSGQSIDYAEIESRVKRVVEEVLRG